MKSICPKCYKEAEAKVVISDRVYMDSVCETHGRFNGIMEVDTEFYCIHGTQKNWAYYNAVMLNITNDCNTKCKLCYYPVSKTHKPVDWIYDKARYLQNYTMWFSGGEPTMHPEILDILANTTNANYCLTNGIKFADINFLHEYIDVASFNKKIYAVISIHPDAPAVKFEALENIRRLGYKIDVAMFAIQSVKEIEKVLAIWKEWNDVILNIRVRSPFNTWAQEEEKTIYLSQMAGEFEKHYPKAKTTDKMGGNTIYNLNYLTENGIVSLCCSPARTAMDIDGVNCSPKMVTENNKLYPIPLGLMINEGIAKMEAA
ncbi:MAG: radical SAM protein [Desulfobacterales bacterium]|nr:radical SAM protein [Desulfobacterales bacterium]